MYLLRIIQISSCCVRVSSDGSHFCSVGSDKKAILFDGKTGERVCYLGDPAKKEAHSGGIYGVSSINMLHYYMYIEKINVQCSAFGHIRSSYLSQYAHTLCMHVKGYLHVHVHINVHVCCVNVLVHVNVSFVMCYYCVLRLMNYQE